MSNNLKNSINASVLTDVLNWKTIEKSYEDLCKRFGDDAISKYNHKFIFNFYTKETSNLTKARTNINETIFNKSMNIRYHALQFVIRKKPIKGAYKVLSSVMEDFNYSEFDYWYYRFYHGQRALDYDRSKDPKPLIFPDLPTDIIKKIVGKLDIRTQFKLRKVSINLRRLIDSSILPIGNISILANSHSISINVDDVKETFYGPLSTWIPTLNVPLESAMTEVCSRLATFIKNPKLR